MSRTDGFRGRLVMFSTVLHCYVVKAQPTCTCCEDGFYCRHRCVQHPKANGLLDSGMAWL